MISQTLLQIAGVQKRRRKKAKKDRYSIQSNQRKRLTQYLSQGGGEVNNKQKKIQTLFARDVEMESSRSSQRLFMCRYLPEIQNGKTDINLSH